MQKSYYTNVNAVSDNTKSYFCVIPTNGETEIGWIEEKNYPEDNQLSIDLNMYYSFNKIDWTAYVKGSKITTSVPVYFKGNNDEFYDDQVISEHVHHAVTIKLSLNKLCNLSGRVGSIINVNNGDNVGIVEGFNKLFKDNSYIKSIKNLILNLTLNSEVTSGNGTYSELFYNCSSLLDTPVITSNLIAVACSGMFKNCTSLVTINRLPRVLAESCYSSMFEGCTSLTKITNNLLPAETCVRACYASMFKDCTSLAYLPSNLLPATTLAYDCYYRMFEGCSNLEELPKLPATSLQHECYMYMFKDCPKVVLNYSQSETYKTPYRIPFAGDASITTGTTGMFQSTDSIIATPSINTIYYSKANKVK